MLQWMQAASLCTCAISHHLELKESYDEKTIFELKEELVMLREAYVGEISSLKEKAKKAEEKHSAKEKQWEAQEKILQDKVASLENKFEEHKDFYATEAAKLKEALNAKMKYAQNLKGEAIKQYTKGFDKALKQVKFLYANLDVSSSRYFKKTQDGQLVDKPLPGANVAKHKGKDQTKSLEDAADHTVKGEDVVDDSLVAPQLFFCCTQKFFFLLCNFNTIFLFLYIY